MLKIDLTLEVVDCYKSARQAGRGNGLGHKVILDYCNLVTRTIIAPDGYIYAWDGEWRHLHGISTNRTPIGTALEKARQLINGPLSAEADYLRGLCEVVDRDTANLYSGLIMMLSECRELMEVFMAELSEPPSIHSWYREGYKDATENAAGWFTRFLTESGMVGESEGGDSP